jgi:uncharacterized protein (TIGR03067 family)
MKFHALFGVMTSLLLGVDALPPQVAADIEGLQGEWRLVYTQDEKHTDFASDHLRMFVGANAKVVFRLGALITNQGSALPRRSGKTRCLDLKLAGGRTLLGVFERDGDDLVLCFDEAGKPRPAHVTPRGTQWAERWRRERP